MTRGAKGCLLAAGAMLIVLVVVAAAVMLAGGIRKGTVIELTIAGEIAEDSDDTLQARLFQGDVTLMRDVTRAIYRARDDRSVSGIAATIKPFGAGFGKIQEIRDAIKDFRASGKWAVVYMDTAGEFSGGNGAYYLATAFDEIWLSPAGDVNLYGLLGVATFLRGTLDKLGVYPDFDSIGKYKNAKDIYTEKSMTEAHREAATGYLQDWFDQIAEGIAEGREMTAERALALLNGGPYPGDVALEEGLIDRLAYYDELETELKTRNNGDLTLMDFEKYLEKSGARSGRSRIAVITGMGVLIIGKSSTEPTVGALMGSETIVKAFEQARQDSAIKAIVFRVDSPGGSAVASDLIWRQTQLARQEGKPVVVSMSDLAASGGYYVSAGSSKIVAQPGTLTGSIGVVAGKMVTTGFYDWIGLSRDTIRIGGNATYYYTGEKFSDREKEIYWQFMNKIYGKFTGLVAEGRGKTVEEVDRVGQGRVWTGTRAKELGLVDELGGMQKAIELAKSESGIPADEEVRLVYLPEKKSFLENLLWPDEETQARAVMPPELAAALRDVARMSILSRERVLLLAEPPVLPQ